MNNNPKVLLIDDDHADFSTTIDFIIEGENFDFEYSGSALDGLELIKNNNYDLIYIDANMPEMNGIELTKKIRDLNIYQPRIFIISSNDMDEYITDAYNALADGIMPKPFMKEQLIAQVKGLTKLKRFFNKKGIIS